MLQKKRFKVTFKVEGVEMDEVYLLPNRTEESNKETLRQAAKGEIAKELRCRRSKIELLDIKAL